MLAADFGQEPGEGPPPVAASGERRLWAEALGQLVRDAAAYWRGVDQPGAPTYQLEAAFDDLCRCGPMLRYLCQWLDVDAQTVSEQFIRWVEARDYEKTV